MAENKKSVLLYCDLIHTVEKLDDATAGQLFKHYLRYINDQNPTAQNPIVDIAFEPIKQQLKRDLRKWEEKTNSYSAAGKESVKSRRLSKTQLYVLNFFNDDENFLKIGITDDSIGRRYSSSGSGGGKVGYKFEILHQYFPNGRIEVLELERQIGEKFGLKRYSPLKKFAGYTECYDISSLNEILMFIASFNDVQQVSTNPTVSDSVNVSVNDNVNVNEILLEKVPKRNVSKKVPDYAAEDLGECKPDRMAILLNWLEYKRERSESYKSIGLKTIVKKFNSFLGPVKELESIVESAIMNNYSGIVWFKYQTKQLQQTKNPIG